MARYAAGDTKAFTPLWRRLEPKLRRFLSRRLRDDATIDDVLQQAVLRIHRSKERFAEERSYGGSVEAWFLTTTHHAFLDHVRSEQRRKGRIDSVGRRADPAAFGVPPTPSDPERALVDIEQRLDHVATVRAAVRRLPPLSQEIIFKHKLQGKPFHALADDLGIVSGTLRVRAHRAYRQLARELHARGSSASPGLM